MHDIEQQYSEFGLASTTEGDPEGDKSDSGSDSSASEFSADVNYTENVKRELQERAEVHSILGDHAVLYLKKNPTFKGICVYTGAEKSVGGRQQYFAHLDHVRAPKVPLDSDPLPCLFGDSWEIPLGVASIRFPVNDEGEFLSLNARSLTKIYHYCWDWTTCCRMEQRSTSRISRLLAIFGALRYLIRGDIYMSKSRHKIRCSLSRSCVK